jgi:hypothetical protein
LKERIHASIQRGGVAEGGKTVGLYPKADESADRQSVAWISEEAGIRDTTLYVWGKGWPLEVKVVPASQKDPEGWSSADTSRSSGIRWPHRP